MKFIFGFILIGLISHISPAQSAWSNKRIVYIFAQDRKNEAIKLQQNLLRLDPIGCAERDIEIIVVADSPQREILVRKYKYTAPEFMLVLVGKDGTEKFRSMTPVNTDQLFAIIDSMPMRKSEIRSK